MLRITIPAVESWDEKREEFVKAKEQTLTLEHSLVSLSKWESKWCTPFLSKKAKTPEMTIDYIKCMTLTQNVNPEVYTRLTPENIAQINSYIEASMTATRIYSDSNKTSKSEQLTSELIYYYMTYFNIPFECQKWHLNRLLTLINVCGVKNQKPKKRSKGDIMRRNAALNAQRRKKYNTKG